MPSSRKFWMHSEDPSTILVAMANVEESLDCLQNLLIAYKHGRLNSSQFVEYSSNFFCDLQKMLRSHSSMDEHGFFYDE